MNDFGDVESAIMTIETSPIVRLVLDLCLAVKGHDVFEGVFVPTGPIESFSWPREGVA